MKPSATAPFGDLYPTTMPHTVEDLAEWEPSATLTFLHLGRSTAEWVVRRTIPPIEAIWETLETRRRDRAEILRCPIGLAPHVLLLRGVHDLHALWELGNTYRRTTRLADDDPTEVLRRHRAGYTKRLLVTLSGLGLDDSFVVEWEHHFPVPDLTLLLDAGYTAGEVSDILTTRTYPERAHVEMLAGLRAGPR